MTIDCSACMEKVDIRGTAGATGMVFAQQYSLILPDISLLTQKSSLFCGAGNRVRNY
jgi:hypothetical protein